LFLGGLRPFLIIASWRVPDLVTSRLHLLRKIRPTAIYFIIVPLPRVRRSPVVPSTSVGPGARMQRLYSPNALWTSTYSRLVGIIGETLTMKKRHIMPNTNLQVPALVLIPGFHGPIN